MIRTGIHWNYWIGTGAENDLYEILRLSESCGAEALDYGTRPALLMSAQQRREFAAAVRGSGLALTLNGTANPFEISDSNEENRKAGVEEFKKAIRASADLGSSAWSGVMVVKWSKMPTEPFNAARKAVVWENTVRSLKELCEYARPLGVDVCVEVVNRFDAYFVNTAEDGIKLSEDVGCANMKLLLDVFHMNIEEDSTKDALRDAITAKRLGYLHISESNRRMPGLRKTDMDWAGICETLKDCGYEGSVIIESLVMAGAAAASSFRIWRDYTASPDKDTLVREAAQGIGYIKSLLK